MKLIIEEHLYAAEKVSDILREIDGPGNTENIEGKVSVNYVGYFYNHTVHDCVFILPKVLLEDVNGEERVFGKYNPEDIIELDKNKPLTDDERNFIYEFAVWIYRAITVFHNDKHTDSSIVYHKTITQVGKNQKRLSNTLFDVIMSLIDFNRENQNFFFFILRNIHSGLNKINWTRTIAHSSAIVQNDTPVYIRPVNKRRQINFDEELLVIFFSILNYVNEHYGFSTPVNCNFKLITGNKFDAYMNGLGMVRLRQIKYKYFSDKALRLWELCYAFFDKAHRVIIDTKQKDYLLVKNFNIVFEAIIDELVGEPRDKIPAGLKDQPDGKRIDHIYCYQSLTSDDKKVYYIGDSKYYKRGNEVATNSVFKQFTYARNVIQWNLNLFMDKNKNREEIEKADKDFGKIGKLRDDITEGYDVIPNFFISANQNSLKPKNDIKLIDSDKGNGQPRQQYYLSRQFENRLFDRDTLIVAHYDVNFLFVVSLYGRNNAASKERWRQKVRKEIRDETLKILNENYDFYIITAKSNFNPTPEIFIKKNFKLLVGKIRRFDISPNNGKMRFCLALRKPEKEKEYYEKIVKNDKLGKEKEKEITREKEKVMRKLEEAFDIVSSKIPYKSSELLQGD